MKNLSIVLTLTIVLGMVGCDTGSTPQLIGGLPVPFADFNEGLFDKFLQQWTEQGISDYSFDVEGFEFEPNTPIGPLPYSNVPADAKFCAHVTVADGGIVSIENVEPDELSMGAYTWGAIPDICDKIRSISLEEASSPYGYDWQIDFDSNNVLSRVYISIYSFEPFSHPELHPLSSVLLYMVLFYINNFQVTENVSKEEQL